MQYAITLEILSAILEFVIGFVSNFYNWCFTSAILRILFEIFVFQKRSTTSKTINADIDPTLVMLGIRRPRHVPLTGMWSWGRVLSEDTVSPSAQRSAVNRMSFWGKSAISPIAMALSVSLCVRLRMCVTFVNRGRILAKLTKCKNDIYTFWYLPLSGAIPKVVLRDLEILFTRSNISNANISKTMRAG